MSFANELERYMLTLVNAERSKEGLHALQLEQYLNTSADNHSAWMIESDIFSHTGQNSSTPTDRMRAAGFDLDGSWSTGENLAIQSERGAEGWRDDVADLHEALMNSPGHRANVLEPDFDYVGIGITGGMFRYDSEVELFSVAVTQNFASTDGVVHIDSGAAGLSGGKELQGGADYDRLTGTAFEDLLDGGAGADRLEGQAGNDVYVIDTDRDVVVEEADGGFDTVHAYSSYKLPDYVERLELHTENVSENDRFTKAIGNSQDNVLIGDGRDNLLIGREGADILSGNGGMDVFVFDRRPEAKADLIEDFSAGQDMIWLKAALIGAVPGAFDKSMLQLGQEARDTDDRLIFDPASRMAKLDVDGIGGETARDLVQFASGSDIPYLSDLYFG